jgi:hypothetical protein
VIWPEAAALAGVAAFTLRAWLIVRPPSKPKLPPVAPPKPPARDATPDEAMQDMQGKGGVVSSLDDREF